MWTDCIGHENDVWLDFDTLTRTRTDRASQHKKTREEEKRERTKQKKDTLTHLLHDQISKTEFMFACCNAAK
jgi:hypothetical protein